MKSASCRFLLIFFLCSLPCVLKADNSPEAYYQAGLSLYKQKNYSLAEKYLKYVLQVKPTDSRAHQLLGQIYYFQNQKDKAAQEIGESLKLNPDNKPLQSFYATLQPALAPTASAAIADPGLPSGAIGGNGAPLSSYVWDPAVDPYPLYTGQAKPLPKPTLYFLPDVYLTLAFDLGFVDPIVGYPGYYIYRYYHYSYNAPFIFEAGDHSFTSIPVKLHYQLDRQVSLVGGVEFWSSANYKFSSQSSSYNSSYNDTTTSSFQITPLTFGIWLDSPGKDFTFDVGLSAVAMFYQSSAHLDNIDVSSNQTNEDVINETNNGFSFGSLLDLDLSIGLDPKNQFAVFVDSKCYFAPEYDFSMGFASSNFSETQTQTYLGTTTTTNSSGNYPKADSVGFFGASVGLGFRGGF